MRKKLNNDNNLNKTFVILCSANRKQMYYFAILNKYKLYK